jgi:hypothetical protein
LKSFDGAAEGGRFSSVTDLGRRVHLRGGDDVDVVGEFAFWEDDVGVAEDVVGVIGEKGDVEAGDDELEVGDAVGDLEDVDGLGCTFVCPGGFAVAGVPDRGG